MENRGFVSERLREAMDRKRMTAAALAEAVGVSPQAISRYLKGEAAPRPVTLGRIAESLGESVALLTKPIITTVKRDDAATFFRSFAASTKRARRSYHALARRSREVADYIQGFVEFPAPDFDVLVDPHDPTDLHDEEIEAAAAALRSRWGLGTGPIANMVGLLEAHGGVVIRTDLRARGFDAFSQWSSAEGRPYFVLGAGKRSAVRSRFDAAHELGHMVLHRHLAQREIAETGMLKLLETQAHLFAGAFLLPAESFGRSVYLPTLDALLELKPAWGVSVAAMIMRLGHLGLISDRQRRRLFVAYSQKGWKKREPMDDEVQPESPSLLKRAFDLTIEGVNVSPAQLATEIGFHVDETQAIVGAPLGYFKDPGPRLELRRQAGASEARVLEFRARPQ